MSSTSTGYAFGVTKVKGFAGRCLDLDLDVFRGTSLIRRLPGSAADVHRRTTAHHRAGGKMTASEARAALAEILDRVGVGKRSSSPGMGLEDLPDR